MLCARRRIAFLARRPGRSLLTAGLLVLSACSSSTPAPAPARPIEAPVSDPAATAARISGDWQVAVERGGQSVESWLHFGLNSGVLVGSLTGADNNPREISKITLRGDKISWIVQGDTVKESYAGTLKGSSMEGTLTVSRGGGGTRRGGGSDGQEGSSGRSGGGRRGGGGRGGGRGGGGGGAAGQVTWRAFRSVPPAPSPSPEPTKPPVLGL
jgi:hypothetical protein